VAIKVKVRNNRQIIVPLRFARAVTGAPVIDAPEVDDRGFAMGNRPGTWGSSDARGAMMSIAEGDTVRVKVVREDIDAGAELFVTSNNTAIVTVEGSAGPLPASGEFSLRAAVDVKNTPVKIQVHLGAVGGPVLGELEPHVFQLRQLRVRAHLVTINGTPTVRSAADLTPLFNDANVIWRPAGIEFIYREADTLVDPINLAVAGQVTTNLPNAAEFDRVIGLRPDRTAINVYFAHASNEWLGLTTANDFNPHGIAIVDQLTLGGTTFNSNSNDLAHELGHFLDLPLHAGENAASVHFRHDIFSERRLLFENNPFSDPLPHRGDVGYGANLRGALIDVKDFTSDPTDGSVARSRVRSRNPF
jgi:hypothetical protein